MADLLGPGGTLVNGRPTRWAELADGDDVQIGPYRLAVRRGPWANRFRRANLPAVRPPESNRARRPRSPLDPPPVTAPTPAVNPTIRALIDEVGQMQRQVADQFQHALVTMFQMFEGMHREQMDLIRGEMTRLHQLAEDERRLRAELERRPPPAPAGRPTLRLVGEATDRPEPADAPPPRSPRRGAPPDPTKGDPGRDLRAANAGVNLHVEIARKLAAIQDKHRGAGRGSSAP